MVDKNLLGPEVTERLTNIFNEHYPLIKRSFNPSHCPTWEKEISTERLGELSNFSVPKNRTKNMISLDNEEAFFTLKKLVAVTVANALPSMKLYVSGYFYYPESGFMGWHTNHDRPTDRLYVTYSSKESSSFFRYYENGKVVTDFDNKGVTVRRFAVPGTKPYFWHCVGSACDRISIGFILEKPIVQKQNFMAKYALVKDEEIVDICEWNGDLSLWSPPEGLQAVLLPEGIGKGDAYRNGQFEAVVSSPINEDAEWVGLRDHRNRLLRECDWVSLRSFESKEPIPDPWLKYRQELRDLPAITKDPNDAPWPLKPID